MGLNTQRIKLYRLFKYLKFYFEPNEKELGKLAYDSCREYYAKRPLRSKENPYPSVADYSARLEETLRYQRAFKDRYRHEYAKQKMRDLKI